MKIFLVCSGLGNVKRGFESFTQECFEALSQESCLDITLFKGGGKNQVHSITLPNIPRNTWLAKKLGKLIGRNSYFIEQISFAINLLPYIQFKQPDIIYFSDGNIGNLLWHWRRLTKQNYKLLFSNGGPLSPPFQRWDLIQQLTPGHYKSALNAGEPKAKHSLVPYGINISDKLSILSDFERRQLRSQLGFPEERKILLSVGVIDKSHKRMDYLIREVASLPEPRPYVLLLGQQGAESSEIIELAHSLLGNDNFQVKTVVADRVASYYQAADIFVLASLGEGLARVFLEAMSYGLPCLTHDYEVTRFVFSEEGYFADFKLTGNLANLVSQVLAEGDEPSKRHLRYQSICERFSWEELRPAYVEMIEHCVNKYEQNTLSIFG